MIYRLSRAYVAAVEGGGEGAATIVSLTPGVAKAAVYDGGSGGVDGGGSVQEPQRRQSHVVRRILGEIIYILHLSLSRKAGCFSL